MRRSQKRRGGAVAEYAPLVAAVALILAIISGVTSVQQRRAARAWRIRAKEAQAWADEYQRERDIFARQVRQLAVEIAALRASRDALQGVVALRTRQLLATNYAFIAYNVRRRE